MARPVTINSLSRGAQILRFLSEAGGSLGVTELAERLQVDPSTAYRLLATLENHGLVAQDQESKKYTVGYGVLEIAAGLLRRLNVAEIAQPHLRALSAVTGESTHIAVRNGTRAVSVGSEAASGVLRVEMSIGNAEPLYCTAVGKALLTDFVESDLRAIFAGQELERFTAQTITSIEDLAAELERGRRLGYAYDDEELHPGVRCIACPIRDHGRRVVAAVGISMPAIRMSREQRTEIVRHISPVAELISTQLGYAGEAQRASE